MGLEYLPTFGLNSWDQCNYSSPMERFGGWWWSHQNLKKNACAANSWRGSINSIECLCHRNRWDTSTLHGISQSQKDPHVVYLPTNSPEKSTFHVAKQKIHGSYGNVLKNLQLYCPLFRLFNPIHPNISLIQRQKTISELYSPTLNPGTVINGVKWGPKNKGIFHQKMWIFGRL